MKKNCGWKKTRIFQFSVKNKRNVLSFSEHLKKRKIEYWRIISEILLYYTFIPYPMIFLSNRQKKVENKMRMYQGVIQLNCDSIFNTLNR